MKDAFLPSTLPGGEPEEALDDGSQVECDPGKDDLDVVLLGSRGQGRRGRGEATVVRGRCRHGSGQALQILGENEVKLLVPGTIKLMAVQYCPV